MNVREFYDKYGLKKLNGLVVKSYSKKTKFIGLWRLANAHRNSFEENGIMYELVDMIPLCGQLYYAKQHIPQWIVVKKYNIRRIGKIL